MAALFKVVTRGEVVAGHSPAEVRIRVADKTKLGHQALDTLFSGRKAVLKKDQLAAQAQHWIEWFGALGLQAYPEMQRDSAVVPTVPAASPEEVPVVPASGEYAITFAGKLVPGSDQAQVMELAQRRWRVDVARLELMFSGKRVALRRGLSEAEARKQLESFAAMGLVVAVSPSLPRPMEKPVAAVPPSPQHLATVLNTDSFRMTSDLPSGSALPVESPEEDFPSLSGASMDSKLEAQMARTELNSEAFRNYASEWDKKPVSASAVAEPVAKVQPSLALEPLPAPPPVVAPIFAVPSLAERMAPVDPVRPFVPAPIPVEAPSAMPSPIRPRGLFRRWLRAHATTLKALRMPFLLVLVFVIFVLVWLR